MAALPGIPLRTWQAQSQTFDYRGHAIRYWTVGAGEPLVLIHGFPSASWDWNYVWQPLAIHFRLVACDMLGFGFSAKPRGYDYSVVDQADLHEALLGYLGIEQYHLLGHDYGDSVVQELLARHNERARHGYGFVASACFLNGGLFPEAHRPVLAQRLLASRVLGPLVGRVLGRGALAGNFRYVFGPSTQPSQSELDDFWRLVAEGQGRAVMHKLLRYMDERRRHRERWVGALQQAKVPLRVIDGAVDPVSGAHMVARYRELVPNPDTVLLEGIGHYPQVEAPERVLAAYLEFRGIRTP